MIFFIQKYAEMIISSTVGTLGFCLFYNVKKKRIIYGCIAGMLSTVIYLVCIEMGCSLFVQNMIPAIVATLYAEIMARVIKAPATVFLLPGVIPLTPGGKLYYTMCAIVDGNKLKASVLGQQTVVIALGIAIGIVIVSIVFYQSSHRRSINKVRYEV